ncbi:MAG: hypothetical protein ABI844_19480 [Saprospiraceae bacterium]
MIKFKNEISLFHYSGHAGRDSLGTTEELSKADGIAHLLGQCKNLKYVFLNGCSTQDQVIQLLDKGIPAVIGTSAPINDEIATEFSIKFYMTLANHENLQNAFEATVGAIKTNASSANIQINRAIGTVLEKSEKAEWGLFVKQGKEDVLKWQIPNKIIIEHQADFEVNKLIRDTLYEALKPYSIEIKNLIRNQEEGNDIEDGDRNIAILNSLFAPIAEQLRKLLVPSRDEDDLGYERIHIGRIKQIVQTYITIVESFTFILISQLWDSITLKPEAKLNDTALNSLRVFFKLDDSERDSFQMITLTIEIIRVMEECSFQYFIEEVEHIRKIFKDGSQFINSCNYLESLKKRLKISLNENEVISSCQEGEIHLATVFKEISFLSNYILAAVRMIDVKKSRQDLAPKFNHSLIKLVKLIGGIKMKIEEKDNFMDSKSVLLLKQKEGKTAYLNLSPFIFDKNSFEKNSVNANLCFFYNYNPKLNEYNYFFVDRPEDPFISVSTMNLEEIASQFESFAGLIFHQNMNSI